MRKNTNKAYAFLLAFVLVLMFLPSSLFAKDLPDWYTPVMVAITNDDTQALEKLLTGKTTPASNKDPSNTDYPQSLLDFAVEKKAYKCLALLSKKASKAAINSYVYYPMGNDSWVRTPLVYAAAEGDLEAVKALVENNKNIDLNLRSWHHPIPDLGKEPNNTALHYACAGHFYDVVEYLLSKDCYKNQKNYYGDTPLVTAIKSFDSSETNKKLIENAEKTVEVLFKYNVNIELDNLPDKVRWASLPEIKDSKLPKQVPVVGSWNKAIHFAAQNGFIRAMELLLDKGVDINLPVENYLYTPIQLATQYKQLKMVEFLLREKAGIDTKDITGYTALMKAVQIVEPKLIELLLKNKANINSLGDDGQCALALACNLDRQYKESDSTKILKLLIKYGADVNAKSDKGFGTAALHWASGNINSNKTDRAKLLLDNKANPNITDINGDTPLMRAAYYGYYDIAKLLIGRGADVNIKNKKGKTALMTAAEAPTDMLGTNSSYSDLINLFISKGADVNAEDSDFKTALAYAKSKNHKKNISTLEKYGAKLSSKEKKVDYTKLLNGTWTTENAVFKYTYTFKADKSWVLEADVSNEILKNYPKSQQEAIRSQMLISIQMQGTKGKYSVNGSNLVLSSTKVLGIEFRDNELYLNGERYKKIK